jgi:hypothetical protein
MDLVEQTTQVPSFVIQLRSRNPKPDSIYVEELSLKRLEQCLTGVEHTHVIKDILV